jgi:hypothetical protein
MSRAHAWLRIRSLTLAFAALGLLSWGLAPSAQAVTIYFNPANPALPGNQVGFGIDAATLPGALAALPLTPLANQVIKDQLGVLFTYTVPRVIQGKADGTSRADPSFGSSTWGISPNTASYQNLWVVFRSMDWPRLTDPTDQNNYYVSENVGLENLAADGWGVWHVPGTSTYYPAFNLGNLAQGATANIPIDYRVAQDLFFNSAQGEFVMPRLLVGYITTVPEPSTVLFMAVGALGVLAVARRRS